MNWEDLKIKIETALPGDVVEIPEGIGPPPNGGIYIPKDVTVVLSAPLPIVQIFGEAVFYPKNIIDKMSEPEWWGVKNLSNKALNPTTKDVAG